MRIHNAIWHARVDMVYALKPLLKSKSSIFNCILSKNTRIYLWFLTKVPKMTKIATFLFLFLSLFFLFCFCSDIEADPGPKYSSLTFSHWNLNDRTAHDPIKISLRQAYVTQHNYDIICLSETFLNSSTETYDDRISIDGYNLIRADHPRSFCTKKYIWSGPKDIHLTNWLFCTDTKI